MFWQQLIYFRDFHLLKIGLFYDWLMIDFILFPRFIYSFFCFKISGDGSGDFDIDDPLVRRYFIE